MSTSKPTCFVVQGFGKKTDYTTGKEFDLNASYDIIKMAAEAAGLECIRADEIVHSGTIDVPMYERLLNADVVIADLSTYNVNAAFELGVRYALKPYTTLVLAEEGFKNPFDLSHIVIRQYKHNGDDIGFKEANRLMNDLKNALLAIVNAPKTDSPVYTYLNGLQPPKIAAPVAQAGGAGSRAAGAAKEEDLWFEIEPSDRVTKQPGKVPIPEDDAFVPAAPAAAPPPPQTKPREVSEIVANLVGTDTPSAKILLDTAMEKMHNSKFEEACTLLKVVHDIRPNDTFVVQQMALATYKSKCLPPLEALHKAKDILQTLNPADTNNPETLGLWGSVHKKIWEITHDPKDLNEAITAHERGFYMKQDNYNGINLAFLLNVRALENLKQGHKDEAIADTMVAKRVRQDVIRYAAKQLESLATDEITDPKQATQRFWLIATLYEANIGLGNPTEAGHWQQQAAKLQVAGWIQETRLSQDEKLRSVMDEYRNLIGQV